MTYVYILSSYHEHGAQGVVATLRRDLVPELLRRKLGDGTPPDDLIALIDLLGKPDEDLAEADGNDLSGGWGGFQLHVVSLDEGETPRATEASPAGGD